MDARGARRIVSRETAEIARRHGIDLSRIPHAWTVPPGMHGDPDAGALPRANHTAASIRQESFRGVNDNGTESGASFIAAQDTNWTQNTDVNFRIRFEIEETAGGVDAATAWQLQYNRNAAGWNNVTGASSVVRSSASTQIADGVATTNRLTAGAGTFIAGSIDEVDGLASSASGITEFDHTEVEYCVQIRSADVGDGDTIQLRVVRNGGTVLEAYQSTPSLTVNVPVQVQQRAYRFRADDGSEAAATNLGLFQNAAVAVDPDETIRVRFDLLNLNAATNTQAFQLQYNLNAAGWNNVDAASSVVRSAASSHVADGAATTDQLTGTGTFTAGLFDEVDGATAAIAIGASGHTEVEFAVQVRGADTADGDTVELRLVVATTLDVLTTYTVTPTLYVKPLLVTQARWAIVGGNRWGPFEISGAFYFFAQFGTTALFQLFRCTGDPTNMANWTAYGDPLDVGSFQDADVAVAGDLLYVIAARLSSSNKFGIFDTATGLWDTIETITGQGTEPGLCVLSTGEVIVVYNDLSNAVRYAHRATNGTWTDDAGTLAVDDATWDTPSGSMHAVADADDRVHFFYSYGDVSGAARENRTRTLPYGGSLSTETVLSYSDTDPLSGNPNVGQAFYDPSNDRVAVVFVNRVDEASTTPANYRGAAVAYATAADAPTFSVVEASDNEPLDTAESNIHSNTGLVLAQGEMYVVFSYLNHLYYVADDGAGFDPDVDVLTKTASIKYPSPAVYMRGDRRLGIVYGDPAASNQPKFLEVDIGEVAQDHTRSETDPLGITDAVAVYLRRNIDVDELGLVDDHQGIKVTTSQATESLGLSDDQLRVGTFKPAPPDVVGLTDTIDRESATVRTTTDGLGLLDMPTPSLAQLRSLSDGLGLLDALAVALVSGRSVTEMLGLSDDEIQVATFRQAAPEALGISDALARAVDRSLETDELGITDVAAAAAGASRATTDGLGLTDLVTVMVARAVAEALGLADGQARVQQTSRSVVDVLALADSITRHLQTTLAEAIGLVDAVDAQLTGGGLLTATITDDLGLTDVSSRLALSARAVTDPLGMVDEAIAAITSMRVEITDALGLTDSRSQLTTLARSIVEAEALADAIVVVAVQQREVADELELADSVATAIALIRSMVDLVGLTDALQTARSLLRSQTDEAGLADDVDAVGALAREITDAEAIADVTASLLRRAVEDLLGLDDETAQSLVVDDVMRVSITDALGLTDALLAALEDISRRCLVDAADVRGDDPVAVASDRRDDVIAPDNRRTPEVEP